jgi:CheY-like chemotaxis protein/anti-sigma regulatory factor (Ser/Thr protein kinase)
LRGDPARLQQVIWNLLSNAVKFTPRDGEIEIVSARTNGHLEIRVIDTGEGIAREFLPHIFERFRQADSSTSRHHGGLGIGLALVKQLVELHGGSVRVTSEGKGKGSCFVVELPLSASVAESSAEKSHRLRDESSASGACSPTHLNGLRVLVVDDERDSVSMLRRILAESQAVVATAYSTDEALSALAGGNIDLLVSDIGMPGRDGYDLVKEMRARGIDIPAVALTAFARSEDRVMALAAGFQAHLHKPVNAAELLATVATLGAASTGSRNGG